jgi:hypothetical protein
MVEVESPARALRQMSGAGVMVNPYTRYYADNLPERRLGVFGIALILCDFARNSLQIGLHYLMCV